MKDPYDMSQEEFKASLDDLVIEEDVWCNTHRIYDFLTEVFGSDANDSILREWTFEWWSDKTGKDYSVIYYKWLEPYYSI
jgi:hypothetical protein